ncbi:hypothetical protein OE88DRAFT_1651427 [Heliocybe sulcata]|uniref:Uncharacterized protein n=1 Tax=Heliocybe sulcata TaxID=5364 RepID=A0A5C3NMB4_9AGAM|nr:hypothetical protein OE88DRAFT_1651427 [Heliocybe sulcata]
MPPDAVAAPSALPTTTRVTRSGIRHSLSLASVGKALADVMNMSDPKGGGGDERSTKRPKEKEGASKRGSGLAMGTVKGKEAPKPVFAEKAARNTPSPEVKTIARRTRSASATSKTGSSSSEEQSGSDVKKSGLTPPGIAPVTRTSSLRAKRAPASTALPKYQPKGRLETIKEPPSPPRKAARKRANSSTDDDKEAPKSAGLEPPEPLERPERAISPLPKRAAFNLSSAMRVTPRPSTPTKKTVKGTAPSRPTPTPKESPRSLRVKSEDTAPKKPADRPTSAASSASSVRMRTPTTPPSTFRSAFGLGKAKSSQPGSPLRKVAKESSATASPTKPTKTASTKTVLSKKDANPTPANTVNLGDTSTDSMDADDVEYMLSQSVISRTAPTPAMPRFRPRPTARAPNARSIFPETPARAAGRSDAFLAPPGAKDDSPLFPRVSNISAQNRQSILSWEQLAASGNQSLGEEEIGHMLSEVQAPFNASSMPSPMASPMRLNLELPDSPMLSALPSPGGFTSISQVLLPTGGTPSPAMHTTQLYENIGLVPEMPEMPAVDGAILTLLRLQLASAEQQAQERAARIGELESQLREAQELRVREEEAVARQMSQLEEQLRTSLSVRDKANEEKEAYINTLHEQLSQVEAAREQAVQEAVGETQASAKASYTAALSSHKKQCELISLATGITARWVNVVDVAEGELEFVRSSKETLSTLLAGLAATQKHLRSL